MRQAQLERTLKGVSEVVDGVILDNPNSDPNDPLLHHVFCSGIKRGEPFRVFALTKQVHDDAMADLMQGQRNDHHRIMDQIMHFGIYVHFKYNKAGYVTDYERGLRHEDTVFEDGKCLFISSCAFNDDLTKVSTDQFGVLDLDRQEVKKLNKVPTPNITLQCYFEWTLSNDRLFIPRLYKVIGIDTEKQDKASDVEWNRARIAERRLKLGYKSPYEDNADDGVVILEENEEEQLEAASAAKGFITGLSSIYIPSLFTETVLLPTYNHKFHSIGCEVVKCSLVKNHALDCYVVFQSEVKLASHYCTLLTRKGEEVHGVFYITLDVKDYKHGFYRHPDFKLIADPHCHLDMARFGAKKYYVVPIRDRLSNIHDWNTLQDLQIVTRFEIVSPGDDMDQIEIVDEYKFNDKTKLNKGAGIVINANENKVISHNFNGITFKLPSNHQYENGKAITFEHATRIIDEDIYPTFQIGKHYYTTAPDRYCTYKDGKFTLKARFNEDLKCYEAVNIFGYIPCKTPPPSPTFEKIKDKKFPCLYKITAKENTQKPGQTILFEGEFVEKLEDEIYQQEKAKHNKFR